MNLLYYTNQNDIKQGKYNQYKYYTYILEKKYDILSYILISKSFLLLII